MNLRIGLILTLAAMAALAAKPTTCTRYPATVYVATDASYGITGDSPEDQLIEIDGIKYSKYVDGQGGVEAYVNGGSCAGTLMFMLSGERKLYLAFQNQLNNGTSGPPAGNLAGLIPAWQLYLRGFSFPASAGPYTTMLPVNFSGTGKQWQGGGVRYEPMTSDYLDDNPDFPLYPDMNTPCGTSAVEMSAIDLNRTMVTPLAVTCGAYTGPVAALLQGQKGPSMVNVGQYGMDFKLIIQVNGAWARPQ